MITLGVFESPNTISQITGLQNAALNDQAFRSLSLDVSDAAAAAAAVTPGSFHYLSRAQWSANCWAIYRTGVNRRAAVQLPRTPPLVRLLDDYQPAIILPLMLRRDEEVAEDADGGGTMSALTTNHRQ